MAGNGDKGEPNGLPVDEWGIRVDENSRPVGSCVARGGDTNGPAAVYSITKYLDWMKKYAPPAAQGMTFSEVRARPVAGRDRAADVLVHHLHRRHGERRACRWSTPTARRNGAIAPSPHGAYWEAGQKLGYQDAGSWTLMTNTPVERAKAAWLYAQFVTSKTVDVKKSHTGLTFIRESTIQDKSFTERAPKLGGLVEFYRSPARVQWSPTGTNVPDYPKLSAALVAEHRRRRRRRQDAAAGDGRALQGAGGRHGPP